MKIAIIGAGFTGCSIALKLSEKHQVSLFEKELGLKSILMGFGLDSDAIHSPNEHYGVFNYLKGIETIPLFFKYFHQLKTKK